MSPHRTGWGWVLVLLASTAMRLDLVRISAWNRDAAAGLWIGLDWMSGGSFPLTGINSSTGAMTPNGVPLLGAALSFLPGGLWTMSLALSLSQMLAMAWLCTRPRIPEGAKLLMAAVILLDPPMIMHSLDIWNLYPTLTLLCLTACCLDGIRTNGSRFWWLASGFCISWLPALYLGNIAALLALMALALIRIGMGGGGARSHESRGSDKGSPRFHPVYAFIFGTLPAVLLSIVPYAAFLHANPEARDLLLNQAHLQERDLPYLLKAITHPFRLLFIPRGHILFGDSNIISDATECGAIGSFHSQLRLHLLLLGSLAFAWVCCRRRSAPCSFTRHLGLFYILVLAIFLILPSKVFTKDQQGVPYSAFVWVLLLAPGMAAAWNAGIGPRRMLIALASIVILNGMLLGHRVGRDHLTYAGERVSPAGAPLQDVMETCRHVVLQAPTKDALRVDYDFEHGSAAQFEREYRVYLPRNPAGSMASGRILDAEFLLGYGLMNQNEGLALRDKGDGNCLVTWSFVSQDKLTEPWKSRQLSFHDCGRLRIFKRMVP